MARLEDARAHGEPYTLSAAYGEYAAFAGREGSGGRAVGMDVAARELAWMLESGLVETLSVPSHVAATGVPPLEKHALHGGAGSGGTKVIGMLEAAGVAMELQPLRMAVEPEALREMVRDGTLQLPSDAKNWALGGGY